MRTFALIFILACCIFYVQSFFAYIRSYLECLFTAPLLPVKREQDTALTLAEAGPSSAPSSSFPCRDHVNEARTIDNLPVASEAARGKSNTESARRRLEEAVDGGLESSLNTDHVQRSGPGDPEL